MEAIAAIALDFTEAAGAAAACRHCGAPCLGAMACASDGVDFCCSGCRAVFELLHEHGLERFYKLDASPGVRPPAGIMEGAYGFLNDEAIRRKAVDFADGAFTRVTFRIPAIHCVACIWLLENLFRLRAGIGSSQVNFPRKEVTIQFEDAKLTLGGLAGFLAALGYEPDLNLAVLNGPRAAGGKRRLYLQIGLAGFAFGNVMLLCFPSYLGLPENDTHLQPLFGWIAAAMATPVFFYSARDYWRAAWLCVRRHMLTVELPIFAGLTALYVQSLATALRGGGPAYFDSFTGLVLFLLCSKLFQQKTFDALSFDRDFRAYFPLSITRRDADGDRAVPVMRLRAGDRILVRHHELIPADSTLIEGPASIDYSFVTGESAPQARAAGDYIYAGGRQCGPAIELAVAKETSQSYLTSLWNHAAFKKSDVPVFDTITNFAGRYFTYAVLGLAALTAAYWSIAEPSQAVRVVSSVLIVACPCALAMAAPFTYGAAMRVLGRRKIFLKNAGVLEALAKVDALVFDKTGTLTRSAGGAVRFEGAPLPEDVAARVRMLAAHSTHAHSRRIVAHLGGVADAGGGGVGFDEVAGSGIRGCIMGVPLCLGARRWLEAEGVVVPATVDTATEVCLAERGVYRGRFVIGNAYRPGLAGVLASLRRRYRLALTSGDNDRERAALEPVFGQGATLHFFQGPDTKLAFIRGLQDEGHRVAMIGDGLNDAGALKQSNVGIAITEELGAFSPACDVIWAADQFAAMPAVMRFSKLVVGVVCVCFLVSLIYNAFGLALAMAGRLSPLASAVLMPASSLTILGISLLGARLAAYGAGLKGAGP